MSTLDWGSFFRNVLGNRSGGNMEDSFTTRGFDEDQPSTEEEEDQVELEPTRFWGLNEEDDDIVGLQANDGTQLYLGNLPVDVTEPQIVNFLMTSHDVAIEDDFTVLRICQPRLRRSMSYAFIKCSNRFYALDLLDTHRRMPLTMNGRRLRLEYRDAWSIQRERNRSLPRPHQRFRPLLVPQEGHQEQADQQHVGGAAAAVADNEDSSDSDFTYDPFSADELFDITGPRSPGHFFTYLRRSQSEPTNSGEGSAIAPGTSWTSAYAQMRRDGRRQLEELETQLSEKLKSTDATFRKIDCEKKFKEVRHRLLLKQMEKLKSDISKLESETASLDADRNLAEDALKHFVEEHEVKVQAIEERIKKFRSENEAAKTTTTTKTSSESDANANQLPAENVSDRLFEELECICCFDKMTVPVYQCTHGHLICCKCHVRLRSCPVCREPYSSKPIRNRLAEALVEIANKKEETSEG